MSEGPPRQDALAEVLVGLVAAPIASGLRTIDQIRRGSEELVRTIENLNATLETLNETSSRINELLAEFEEPVRAAVPQLTRTIRTADEISQLIEGPMRTMAPALPAIADMVATTPVDEVATQAAEAMSMLREMAARLGPLAQVAENAGGLLGAFRLPGLGGPSRSSDSPTTKKPRATTTSEAPDEEVSEASSRGIGSSSKKTSKKKQNKKSGKSSRQNTAATSSTTRSTKAKRTSSSKKSAGSATAGAGSAPSKRGTRAPTTKGSSKS